MLPILKMPCPSNFDLCSFCNKLRVALTRT
jgi:hypothetical protein